MASATQQRIAGLAANGDKIKTGAWTEDEDAKLAAMQAKVGNRWSEVALHVPGRTGQQCAQRWRHKVNPNIRKEKWSEEEDRLLAELVQELGPRWADIARRCPGRTDQQCMGRWRRHLDPSIKRDAWSAQEDAALRRLHKLHGRQWSLISKRMSARTAQQCRARFFQIEGPQSDDVEAPPVEAEPQPNPGRQKKKAQSGKPPRALPSPKPVPANRRPVIRPLPSRRFSKVAARPLSSASQSVLRRGHESAGDEPTKATSNGSGRRGGAVLPSASEAHTPKKGSACEREPPRTPRQPTLAASSSAPLLSAGSVPLLAALSPQQTLSASLLASTPSPLLAQWTSSPLSRLLSPQLLQESLAQWRFSPSPSLSPFGPSFFLPADAASTPPSSTTAAASLAMPRASSSPAELPPWSQELIRKGEQAVEAAARGRLFSGVKRRLSMNPLDCETVCVKEENAHSDDAEAEACESEELSPGWKRLRAESDGRRESMFLSTPIQFQANLSSAGRPSLTPVVPKKSSSVETAAENTAGKLAEKEKAAADALASLAPAVGLPRPKQELTRRRPVVASSGMVAASRQRLNALLRTEDLTAAF